MKQFLDMLADEARPRVADAAVGLCADCRHAGQVASARGSLSAVQLAARDPRSPVLVRATLSRFAGA